MQWRKAIAKSRCSGCAANRRVLANIPPSIGQRQTAPILMLALLAILATTGLFAAIKLPEMRAFVPLLQWH